MGPAAETDMDEVADLQLLCPALRRLPGHSRLPAVLLAQRARVVDLDSPLLIARDRPDGLRYDGSMVRPPNRANDRDRRRRRVRRRLRGRGFGVTLLG